MELLLSKLAGLVGLSVDKIMEAYPVLAKQIVIHNINDKLQLFFVVLVVALTILVAVILVEVDDNICHSLLEEWNENPTFKKTIYKRVKRILFVAALSLICSLVTFLLTPDLQMLQLLVK